jgi:hypothetical protein
MNSQACMVWRNGITCTIPVDQLQITDFVLPTTGQYVAASQILRRTEPALAQGPTPNLAAKFVLAGLFVGAIWLMAECSTPQRRAPLVRRRNRERLEPWKKEYVSERDRWRCTYYQRRVTRANRHIDHSVSRRNGGSNHLNNLRTACRDCNLYKGSLNARQFLP